MQIRYILEGKNYVYEQTDPREEKKLSLLLTNPKGDFLQLGANTNSSKFEGLSITHPTTLEVFKILDWFGPQGVICDELVYSGPVVERYFSSQYTQGSTLSHDRIYLGPTGGMIYEITDFQGTLSFDLDCKRYEDFDEWGRLYEVYKKDDIVFVSFKKMKDNTEQYKLFFGIRAMNFNYEIIKEWVKKEYEYDAMRGSGNERYVFRPLKVHVQGSKKFVMGCGFSESEVRDQIELLSKHQTELESFDFSFFDEVTQKPTFASPLTQDAQSAYILSNYSLYKFVGKSWENIGLEEGAFAGYPWFTQVWARDELVSLRGFIEKGDEQYVKRKLFLYLGLINEQTGMIRRLVSKPDSLESADAVFWLAKRCEDFLFSLEKTNRIREVFIEKELFFVYDKLKKAFEKIVSSFWRKDLELISCKDGDSWMDTVHLELPLDIQVGFLELVSFLGVLAHIVQKKEDSEKFLDFECVFREKIRQTYYRGGILYNEALKDSVTSNVFFVYYMYPDLFFEKEWEQIFDRALEHLSSSWGGLASMSRHDGRFRPFYTGEKNESYHQGDSWFWINNYAAIALHDLNEHKYRDTIKKILLSSTQDILRFGSLGFASEISSFNTQRSEGCFAQLWSTSTYIEMINKLFEKQ